MAEQQPGQQSYQLRLEWVGLEETPIEFANQMVVQHIQNEFVLSFGHMTPPPFLEPPTKEQVEGIDFVPIKPIVRLGMTPQRLLEVISALQSNYRKYQESLTQKEER